MFLDACYVLLHELDDHPETLERRLDEPLPHEVTEEQARRLELRRQATENQAAVNMLLGMRVK